jgi:hypothetical protein
MSTNIEIIKEVEFNEVAALILIQDDEDLNSIFTSEVQVPINLLIAQAKEGNLSLATTNYVRNIFDKIVLTKDSLINRYEYLRNNMNATTEPVSVTPKSVPTKTKTKVEKELPRRYGKSAIMNDVTNQGGVINNAQLTALSVNDLKNTYVKLSDRLINDMLTDTPIYTDEEYRIIRSTITMLNNKLASLLKKK